MKKNIFIITCFFIINLHSQDLKKASNSFSTIDFSFSIPNKTRYDSSLIDNDGNYLRDYDIELSNKATYGVTYTYNFPVLDRFYLGILGGYSYHLSPKISNTKVGGVLRYKFINELNSANFYLLGGYNISLNDYFKSGFGNIRLGMSFPIINKEKYDLMLGGFWDYSSNESKKSIVVPNEGDGFIFLKSFGVSFGVQF